MFQVLPDDPDNRCVMIDSAIVRAHQQSASGKGGRSEALVRSRSGLTTKIHLVCDAQGPPMRFALPGGKASDGPQAVSLLRGIKAGAVPAD